jgi:lysophospholipase L1-like esterase
MGAATTIALAFCAAAAAGQSAAAQGLAGQSSAGQAFALTNGETVVFYGDSITAQRLYTKDVEEFVLTRYPRLHVRFVNAGVPGDTAAGGYAGTVAERVARDVAPYAPGMITVMLGMNDGGWGYGSADRIDADFQSRYRTLLQSLRQAAPRAAFTLISPTPYDEITHGTEFPGYSKMIDRLADDVSRIATQGQNPGETPAIYVDFHGAVFNALERAKARDPELAALLIPDRIHPAEAGHWMMAAALMRAWRVDPIVSSVELRATDEKVIAAERTAVTELHKSANGLAWSQLDEALPLPLDLNNAMTTLLLQISDVADLDRQMLRVEGLPAGEYQLRIDGKPIAVFSRDELERGVNLALYKTPMLEQARDIAAKEDARADLDRAAFILSADVKHTAATAGAEAGIHEAQDQLDAEIREHLIPVAHRFELSQVELSKAGTSQAQPEMNKDAAGTR